MTGSGTQVDPAAGTSYGGEGNLYDILTMEGSKVMAELTVYPSLDGHLCDKVAVIDSGGI